MTDNVFYRLGKIVNAPEFIIPWLDRFYETVEIELLSRINDKPTETKTIRNQMGIDQESIHRLLNRCVLARDENGSLMPADFHSRYDIWALFEGFKDIPDDIRSLLNQWELDDYVKSHQKDVDNIRKTGKLDQSKIIPRYLLLDEAFDVIDEVNRVYLWPCNCRSMINACSKPVYTCLRFENSKGHGYEISREKAKEIIRHANKKGLMQSGELAWDADGKLTGAICNCCPDCCFPHLLAKEVQAEKIWPFSRYTALWHEQACSFCGLCSKRCPFEAFTFDKKRERKSDRLAFFEALCRGCGLCAETCPEKAIEMEPIKTNYGGKN